MSRLLQETPLAEPREPEVVEFELVSHLVYGFEDPYASLEPGTLVYCKYLDHVLFQNADASNYQPWTRETVGWLDKVGLDYVRIVWTRHWDRTRQEPLRSTGLSIARNEILELREVG